MTSLEKAINLGYLFLTLKPKYIYIYINTCTIFCCMYWYVSIYSEECFWLQYMYPTSSTFNGYHWCPLGKLYHLGLEQLIRKNDIIKSKISEGKIEEDVINSLSAKTDSLKVIKAVLFTIYNNEKYILAVGCQNKTIKPKTNVIISIIGPCNHCYGLIVVCP